MAIHGNRYEYSKFVYLNNHTKGIILCPIHGEFLQSSNDHLDNHGCPKCAGNCFLYTTDQFIEKAQYIHGKKYDYSSVHYTGKDIKIKIVCRDHGPFLQTPHSHLMGRGCPNCANNKSLGKSEFIRKAKAIHKNKYNYSNVNYIMNKRKIMIICKKHGPFYQVPNSHLIGRGCPKCHLSKGEIAIVTYLKAKNIKYILQKSFHDCRNPITNRKLRYDFYIPQKRLLIEYDGIQHFQMVSFHGHPSTIKDLRYTQYKDKVKTKYAHDNNISLLRIKSLTSINKCLNNIFN